MKRLLPILIALVFLTVAIPIASAEESDTSVEKQVVQTRLQAKLLHEMIHGSLQVMHRDFFRNGDSKLGIPSESLEDVFHEFKEKWKIEIEWISVNAKSMTPDHRPDTAFERNAVKAITAGAQMFESNDKETYRYAGVIPLGNQCLKCHVPDRTSLEDRMSAVIISIPMKLEEVSESGSSE